MSPDDHRQVSHVPGPPNAFLASLAHNSFHRIANASRFDGNNIRLLRDGTENYPAWLAAIREAKRTVYLETYILQDSDIGRTFAAALADAARRGVNCRVLYDWLGCRSRAPSSFWRDLHATGVEVRCYNPPRFDNPLQLGSRDHRKVLCIDSEIGFTGGLCIGQQWLGDPSTGGIPWRDTGVEIRGPAAANLALAFADSWTQAGAPIPPGELIQPTDVAVAGTRELWVIAGRPDGVGLYQLEQLVAEVAQRSLWLADAYFVATTAYVQSLSNAARAGVDVRLLVPNASDFPLVQSISRSAYRPLLEAGVRVFEWNGPMMHAKTAVADGCWSRIGSSNSNLASWITNRELDVTLMDVPFAQEMEAMYEDDLRNATEIVLRKKKRRFPPFRHHNGAHHWKRQPGSGGRLLAGAVGFGSTVSAAFSHRRVLGPSEIHVIGAAGVLLLLLASVAVFFPILVAYPIGILAVWGGIALLIHTWKTYVGDPARKKAPQPAPR